MPTAWATISLLISTSGRQRTRQGAANRRRSAKPRGFDPVGRRTTDALRAAGAETVLSLSSVTGAGVTQMLRCLIGIIEDAVAEENRPEEEDPWSP